MSLSITCYKVHTALNRCMLQLFDKRKSEIENGLSSIVEGFTIKVQHEYAEESFADLVYQCLKIIKKEGSTPKEICLASSAIGLLALTTVSGANAHYIYEESIPPLSQALKSKSESQLVSSKILDCLAIITFFGAKNSEETERSMRSIWEHIHPENEVARKQSASVLVAAITAWSFLLTTMHGDGINRKCWQGTISCFLDKLEDTEESVRIAASEALALILETDCLEKFSSVAEGSSTDCSIHEGDTSLKDKILERVRNISLEESDDEYSTKDDDGQACNGDWNHLKIFQEKCYFPEIPLKINGEHRFTLSTWSQSIQLSFLKRFLGRGFGIHMLLNELLHDIFEITPIESELPQRIPDSEEVFAQYFQAQVRKLDCYQRINESSNSVRRNKAKSQLLKKQRKLSQGRHFSHYLVDGGSEEA